MKVARIIHGCGHFCSRDLEWKQVVQGLDIWTDRWLFENAIGLGTTQSLLVIEAKAGIQRLLLLRPLQRRHWIPAFASMTIIGRFARRIVGGSRVTLQTIKTVYAAFL
jgi:hypothetical protein